MSVKNPPLAMRPDGIFGRPFAWIMQRMNTRTYLEVLEALTPKSADAVLEIGYGSGEFLVRAGRLMEAGLLAGVDPTPLMHTLTEKKLRQNCQHLQIDVRQGSDANLEWLARTFDCVASIHSFQFWENPAQTLSILYGLMKPGGRLCFALRQHGQHPPNWLPNPLSRAGNETGALVQCLEDAKFLNVHVRHTKHHSILVCATR